MLVKFYMVTFLLIGINTSSTACGDYSSDAKRGQFYFDSMARKYSSHALNNVPPSGLC